MPRRKKKGKKNALRGQSIPPKEGLFNPAFGNLKQLKKNTDQGSETSGESAHQVKKNGKAGLSEDERLFSEAMTGVSPISRGNRRIMKAPDKDSVRPAHAPKNEELEVMAYLSDLISGTSEMDITFSDEYVEGCIKGLDPRLMQQLKDGLFPVQDYVDLHRLTQEAAETRIRDFLLNSQGRGLRCVLIVHGKGLNSENHIPILKKKMPLWLSRGPVRKIILAFSTARPYDGGTGAIYVLLKRSKGGL
ncbi:MAG: DNA mismatch repair protein MutS [Deltaproteobacteria bacterium]|jgi:DNA-nicking Smr family endonuclease|nr:DNA mismatch repair protein MutS [Deltaproteobacteria bacterium]